MTIGQYLRPAGLVYGDLSKEAVAVGHADCLVGGPVAFTLCEVIEGTPGDTVRELRPYADLKTSEDVKIQAMLSAISAPREPVDSLSLIRPSIMGVVNVTPDSFSDGGLHASTDAAIDHGLKLAGDGADILDIGGESTRPGSDPVDTEDEAERVIPVIEGLKHAGPLISVDTRKSAIMEKAASSGAMMLNDVSALTHDSDSLKVAVQSGLPVILMHAQGDPKTMQDDPVYADVLLEVFDYLSERIAVCESAGIEKSRIIADPGIGFGKTLEHNLTLLRGLSLFHGLGVALMLGASRKRFIGSLADQPDPRAREPGSLAAGIAGVAQGVQMLRVHDVAAMRQALTVWSAINC